MKLRPSRFKLLCVVFLVALCAPIPSCQAHSAEAKFDWAALKKFAVAYDWPRVERRDGQKQPLVEAVQYLLRARGHDVVVDGVFGPQTARELRKFQRQHGLEASNLIEQPTWEALVFPLQRGSRGDGVRALQIRLARHGYDIEVDGIFGPQTQTTLGLFQSSRGNAYVNGRADARTWCFLMGGNVVP